jgi:chemotaxis protein CheD
MTNLDTNCACDNVERKIGIGEIGVLRKTGVLRTLLGSCIGLVLHDPQVRAGGLAHIVLPLSNESLQSPGKYADTAVPELIRQIEQLGGKRRDLTAKLAGGATMFATAKSNGIGEQNLATVEKLLKDAGIPVIASHCGGQQGRRMAYDVQTGIVTVEVVGSASIKL